MSDAEHIHSHGGRTPTRVVWLDADSPEGRVAAEAVAAGWAAVVDIARYAPQQ